MNLREVHRRRRRRSSRSNSSADFAINNNFTYGVTLEPRRRTTTRVVGSLLRTKLVDETSPVVYGVPDNLAMYSDSGDTSASARRPAAAGAVAAVAAAARRGRRTRRRRAAAVRPDAARPTIPTSSRDAPRSRART